MTKVKKYLLKIYDLVNNTEKNSASDFGSTFNIETNFIKKILKSKKNNRGKYVEILKIN